MKGLGQNDDQQLGQRHLLFRIRAKIRMMPRTIIIMSVLYFVES